MNHGAFRRSILLGLIVAFGAPSLHAQNTGVLRGTIRDMSGLVVAGANVSLKAAVSSWVQNVQTDMTGSFVVNSIPIGQYTLDVEYSGFKKITRTVQIISNSAPNLELTLEVKSAETEVDVTAVPALELTAPEAASPPVLVSGRDILQALPGADSMSSLQFITDVTPGAFVLHDHLHVRGGHQIDWLIDGVPIPNTNMSSNIGRALDPKDIQEVQINRGGYSADTGDRTFAQINVVPRSGFEFNNDADLTLTYGSFNQMNDQFSFGAHRSKFAYYTSLSGNRTDLGLEPPVLQGSHAMGSGEGLFTTMSYNRGPSDQFDWTATARNDRFQIPVDPNNLDPASTSYAFMRDRDQEKDSFMHLTWTHTVNSNTLLTISPFYHYNDSRYIGSASDPLIANSRNTSNYLGAETELRYARTSNNLVTGLYGFYQRNDQVFSLATTGAAASVSALPTGGVGAVFVNDQYKPLNWLTFNAGIRMTHFSGLTNENAANPRIGATLEIPKLRWVVRSYYGTYYQAPPLYTVGGGIFGPALAGSVGFGFERLHGERDIQREEGLTIPIHGWIFDIDHFATSAVNFLDHNVLGNSNLLLPLTTPNARMHGEELAIRSPELLRRVRFHLAYSNMVAQYRGMPDGGLINPVPEACLVSFCYLDHDQRNTLSTGFEAGLPWHSFFSMNVVHGSGVLKGDGPSHLQPNTIGDIKFIRSVGESWTMALTVLNISNSRYPFDINNSFAGTHFNNPRKIIGSLRYRFHL